MKKSFNIKKLGIAAVATSCLIGSAGFAGTWNTDQSGNWSTPARWVDGEPTAGQDAFIRNGTQTAYVTLSGEVAKRLTLAQSGSTASLQILSGDLTLGGDGNGDIRMNAGGTGDTTASLLLSGGALTLNDSGDGFLILNNSAADVSTVTISGGTLDVAGIFDTDNDGNFGTVNVSVVGSSVTKIDVAGTTSIGDNTTLNFNFDAAGISTWGDGTSGAFSPESSANLNIDLSAYTGGLATYRLIETSDLTAQFANVTVNSGGWTYTLTQDQTSDFIDLEITGQVPEPSTLALLGCGVALVVASRRRMFRS